MNMEDFFSNKNTTEIQKLSGGKSFVSEMKIWINKYKNYLIGSKLPTTVENYSITLDAFVRYIERYLVDLKSIKQVSYEHFNDFFNYVEDYKVSKDYGSIKERIGELLFYIKKYNISTIDQMQDNFYDHFSDIEGDERIMAVEYTIKSMIEFMIKKRLNMIDKATISQYIESRKKVSVQTMNQRYIAIVGLLKFIDRSTREDFFANIIWMIRKYPLQKIKDDEVKIGFSHEDEARIEKYLCSSFDGCSAKEIKMRALMVLMMRSGLRASEAIGLKRESVKLSESGKTYSLTVLGKGNAIGKTYIKVDDFSMYYEYLMSLPEQELLIPTRKGTKINRSNLFRDIEKALKAIGVHERGLHIFRHHFASNFASKDGRIGVLQRLLRHSSVQTTMIYSKIREQELSEAISGI